MKLSAMPVRLSSALRQCDFKVKVTDLCLTYMPCKEIIYPMNGIVQRLAWNSPCQIFRVNPFNTRPELKWLQRRLWLSLNVYLASDVYTRLIVLGVVLLPVLQGTALRPQALFTSLPLIALFIETVVYRMINYQIFLLQEARVTVQRLEKFLQLDELADVETRGDEEYVVGEECGVDISNVTARWDEKLEQPTLHNVTASVRPGKLLAVIGPVGAGKSSLLMSIMKELPTMEGSISVKGKIAYVAQQPWVFSGSLRQNITFGNKFEKAKYDRILKACALNKDIAVMPHGDFTLIGDRGVRLSGGQRARVCLARALYMDADVYLLDDPLSAVDASVGRHLFEKVIQGLLKSKPRILVTHQLQYLKEADHLVVLKEGEMIGSGTFNALSTSGIDFTSLLKRDKEDDDESHDHLSHEHIRQTILRQRSHLDSQRSRLDSSTSHHSVIDKGSMISLNSIGADFEAEAVQLPEAEERHEGTVGGGVYYRYFKAGAGLVKFIILTVLCLSAQGAYIMSDWWLSYWSNQEEDRFAAMELDKQLLSEGHNVTNVTIPSVDTHFNVGVFSAIIASVFVFGLLRALMFFKVAVDASQKLHNMMFTSILRSRIGFFDTNPVGRILNRFSKDVGHMDDMLPITFFDFIQCSLLILGIIVVAGVVNPWVFIPVVPLSILFVIIRRYYLRTSRHIKRLEGTTRSPVFSHLSASLQGLQTIRAFRVQEKFIEEFDNHQNLHTEAWFLFLTSSRWLAIRLDWLCAMFVTTVSFGCVLASESLNAGLVGLSMTYAMTLMGMFQWGVRQSAEVENQMISVERVLDYSDLPSEAPLEVDEKKQPPPEWPQQGVISAERASLRYFPDSPVVLKDLTFYIRAKEKVGIVGRTGAGKSSLITMLFRLVEPNGKIMMDGVNIQNIGLHDLRNKISIIPQDPTLFMGSLRRNLDPFGDHEDSALWMSLSEVELKQAIEDLPSGLDTEVSEGGINFSVGQRQLICLARAILRKNKIMMIDEATANVDPRTDALIQQTIREKFHNCTVLTIAHRLNTIMDSDRILVLDDGEITDFDAPYTLLQKADGDLYKMVEQTGKAEMEHLTDIARKAFEKHARASASTEDSVPGIADVTLSVGGVGGKIEEENENTEADANERSRLISEDAIENQSSSNGEADADEDSRLIIKDDVQNQSGSDDVDAVAENLENLIKVEPNSPSDGPIENSSSNQAEENSPSEYPEVKPGISVAENDLGAKLNVDNVDDENTEKETAKLLRKERSDASTDNGDTAVDTADGQLEGYSMDDIEDGLNESDTLLQKSSNS